MSETDAFDAGSLEDHLRAVRERGRRRLAIRRGLAAAGMSLAVLAIAVPTLALNNGGRVHQSTPTPRNVLASIQIPATYEQACANEPHVCLENEQGQVPDLLKRALHYPILETRDACPATAGAPVDTYTHYFYGIALGDGPVRVAVGNHGDLLKGQVQVGSTGTPGWSALETLWFAMPSYDGPFVVRGERLGGSGSINVDGSATNPAPLVVPPGPTANTEGGIRVAPVSTWVTSPGCYAWQVDGLTFSYVIVVDLTSDS
jgi:hypothetical protein